MKIEISKDVFKLNGEDISDFVTTYEVTEKKNFETEVKVTLKVTSLTVKKGE